MEEDKGKLPVGQRFFKVLIPGFEQELRFPPRISKILLDDGEIPEEVVIVSSRGGPWNINVGECNNNGLMLNGEGWDKFVRRHDLAVGQFLVFEHTGNLHFNTLVFDSSTTCQKEFPDDKNVRENQEKKNSASKQGKRATFQVKLHRYSIEIINPMLYIPLGFMKSNLPMIEKSTTATLINPSGEKWKINLIIFKFRHRRQRFTLCGGWKKFVQENNLKVGLVCEFELVSGPGLESESESGSRTRSGRRRNENESSSIVMNVRFMDSS